MKASLIVAALTLGFAVGAKPARAQFSGFASTIEGWSVVSFGDLSANNYSIIGTYAPNFVSAGGNPAGYIQSFDPDGGDFTFSAPAAYLGNQSAVIGSTLSYDLIYNDTVNYNTTDVVIVGGGIRLLWQRSPVLTPTSTWTSVNVSLMPSGQWHVGTTGGALATSADFATAFSNLTGIYIRGEYAFGADDTGLDNVRLGLVPEPTTMVLLLGGLAPVAFFLRRRRA